MLPNVIHVGPTAAIILPFQYSPGINAAELAEDVVKTKWA